MIFILGTIFISLIGSSLHFTYEWSNHNKVVSIFSAVNESTWEHIKIALTPTFIWSILDGLIYFSNPNYFSAKFLSLVAILIAIPIIFYSYTFFTKKAILIVDIISFCVSIFISQMVFKTFLGMNSFGYAINFLSAVLIMLIFSVYLLATIMPLNNFLFVDPITHKIGIKGHHHEHNHNHKN